MQPMSSRTNLSPPGISEIQRIAIGGNAFSEQQVIEDTINDKLETIGFSHSQRVTYTTNLVHTGVAEVQDVDAVFDIFQIGFEGVYTGELVFYRRFIFVMIKYC